MPGSKADKFKSMKTFLVVAGLLMTGASVYGVVDYNKKAESKEFKELYKEAPVPDETDITKKENAVPAEKKEISKNETAVKTETPVKKTVKKKTIKKKKERVLRLKEFSRGKMG